MRDFRDHGQGANSPCADAGDEQEFREIGRAACGCGRQIAMQASRDDVARANVVMVGITWWGNIGCAGGGGALPRPANPANSSSIPSGPSEPRRGFTTRRRSIGPETPTSSSTSFMTTGPICR